MFLYDNVTRINRFSVGKLFNIAIGVDCTWKDVVDHATSMMAGQDQILQRKQGAVGAERFFFKGI